MREKLQWACGFLAKAKAMAKARVNVLVEAPWHTKSLLNFEWSMLNWIHVGFCVPPVPIRKYSSDFGLNSRCTYFRKPTRSLL
jgi:hypothetical protein